MKSKFLTSYHIFKERIDYSSQDDNIVASMSKYMYLVAHRMTRLNATILDIGCGYGWGTHLLSSKGRVIGVDIDRKTISEAKKRFRDNKNIQFMCTDATHLPLQSNSLDTVVEIENIEHIREWWKCLQNIRRMLKKGGLLVISSPNRDYFWKRLKTRLGYPVAPNPYHVHEFCEDELVSLLKNMGFRIIFRKKLLLCLPIPVLRIIKKSRLLTDFIIRFPLPGFNMNFLLVAINE